MAMESHLLRYRAKTTEYLQAKQLELEALDTPFSQQSMGTKSFTVDKRTLTDQLNAIAYVLRERGAIVIRKPAINIGAGVTNFENVDRPSGSQCEII